VPFAQAHKQQSAIKKQNMNIVDLPKSVSLKIIDIMILMSQMNTNETYFSKIANRIRKFTSKTCLAFFPVAFHVSCFKYVKGCKTLCVQAVQRTKSHELIMA